MTRAPLKAPRKISATYLENAALYYLQRYATSAENLRRVLMRKVERSCRFHGTEATEFIPVIDNLLTRYAAAGLIDDAVYARAKVQSLRRQGQSKKAIFGKLQAKGLSKDILDTTLISVDEDRENGDGADGSGSDRDGAELEAARTFVRRKRLAGKEPLKALASLARAGFSYDIAKRALGKAGGEEEEE